MTTKPLVDEDVRRALIDAYYLLNQNTLKSRDASHTAYLAWEKRQVELKLLNVMKDNGIDWREQDPEDR